MEDRAYMRISNEPQNRLRLTEAQADLLRVIAKYGEDGWGEVGLQFSASRPKAMPQYLESAILCRIMQALERRGWAENTDDGPVITEVGRAVLAEIGPPAR